MSALILATPRLLLRDFREDDAQNVVEAFAEPQAQPYILRGQRDGSRMSLYVKSSAKYAAQVPWSMRPRLDLAVVLSSTSELIGMCSLSNATENNPFARVGWHLANKFSGLGYATEMGGELLNFAFEKRKVARVYADCFESNAANVRVLVKLGMQPMPGLPLLKWVLALQYLELKPIVRYAIVNQVFRTRAVAA
jgi:RimJ/RimL family protein N-acetyltransferase